MAAVAKSFVAKMPLESGEGRAVTGWALPAVALGVGSTTLLLTFVLAVWHHQVNWWFVSQMGSKPPAYFFYVLGSCMTGGMLVPCAYIYWLSNHHKLLRRRPDLSYLNTASLLTAVWGAVALAGQSVFPLGEGNPVHIFFATNFFGFCLGHAAVTSYMHYKALSPSDHLPDRLCVYWKIFSTLLTALSSLLTVAIMGYDASSRLKEGWNCVSGVLEWLQPNQPMGALLMAGAFFEYLTLASLLAYFSSYFYDLRDVRILVG